MPRIIRTVVYAIDELSDKAKEKARAWYRQDGLRDEWYYQRRRFRTHGPIFGFRWRRYGPVVRQDCSKLGSSDRGCRRSS